MGIDEVVVVATVVVVVGAAVVVVAGGCVVVVSAGGGDGGAVGPGFRGGVVTTGRLVVAVVGGGSRRLATVVVEGTSVLVVDSGTAAEGVDVVTRAAVVGGVAVDGGDLADTCRGELSEPVATSNNRPTMTREARTYSPALNR